MDNYSTFRFELEQIMYDSESYTSSLDENVFDSEYSSSESNDGYDEYGYQEGELCVCCNDSPADKYCQLEDGFYCTDCYESQKDWD